jgi:prepilin-type N-terminal cleavage/methylation domain-containing protein
MMRRNGRSSSGFTLIELVVAMLVLGVVFVAFSSIFILFQKSATQSSEFTEAQQNARLGVDYIIDQLRQAGAGTDYFRGQMPIVHAGPYQVAINADIDNGRTIDGQVPLRAINRAFAPNTVPASGSPVYSPTTTYQSGAETIVLTLDSNGDGVISSADRGDEPEEQGANRNLFVLRSVACGDNGAGGNEVREVNLALVRGPNLSPTWTVPPPLFQYFYDHDNNSATPDRLWGDFNGSGALESAEISALTRMPQNLLSSIRKVKVAVQGESNYYNVKYETQGGFLAVAMTSEVYVRNWKRASSMIYGRVFIDADNDHVLGASETGIPKVQVGLAGQNCSTITDNFGMFYLPLQAGTYSVQEVDPAGYASTTANTVSITLASGQTSVINFGDIPTTPLGRIKGVVFDDLNRNGIKEASEAGLRNVLISLDKGTQTYTNETGFYSFDVQRGNYTVVETDPVGYSSTTSNSSAVAIAAGTDTVTVNFGDYGGPTRGTLEGHVFLDENEDGYLGGGEGGLPNVTVKVSNGDSTVTDAKGYYRFALEPGVYSVGEVDPVGYTSLTVNLFTNIRIATDSVSIRDFGDALENCQEFVEINIAHTDRALSVCGVNLGEDSMNDVDIVLGTALTGTLGNMLVFHNNWQSSTTPISKLFESEPTYRRDAAHNVTTMVKRDFSGDGVQDILSGLEFDTGRNIQVWHTGSGGVLGLIPDELYQTSGTNYVLDSKAADFNGDGAIDLVVGLRTSWGTYTGGFEIFAGTGGGGFASTQYITTAGSSGSIALGEIWAVDTGDIDGDGDDDVVVGSHTNAYYGYIDIYRNTGIGSGVFSWYARYRVGAAVNDLKAVDMMEDDSGDIDIIAAVSTMANAGGVKLWLNTSGTFGLADTTGFAFDPSETPNWPDDYCDTDGEALCLTTLSVNRDLFPDVAVGTRGTSFYAGDVFVLPTYGTLPPSGIKINSVNSGEVITMDTADFNKDNKPDIVAGTRDSANHGILVVYFGTN